MRSLYDSCKSTFLAKFLQGIHFLQYFFRQYIFCKILARSLQENFYLLEAGKKSFILEKLARICQNDAFSCKILQESFKNSANVFFFNSGLKTKLFRKRFSCKIVILKGKLTRFLRNLSKARIKFSNNV